MGSTWQEIQWKAPAKIQLGEWRSVEPDEELNDYEFDQDVEAAHIHSKSGKSGGDGNFGQQKLAEKWVNLQNKNCDKSA